MAYINVFVSNSANIFVKNNQLCLKNANKDLDYPLEDVNSVMIENLETTISTYTLSKFAQNGILTFVCDDKHLPVGVLLPYNSYYRTLSQYKNQTSMSKPLKKKLWQEVIKNKIRNQNKVLSLCGCDDVLHDLECSVCSGDTTNNEAKASLIYFKNLFGEDFARRKDSIVVNGFLNYGYAIVRGFIARSIVSCGLLPFLGICHCNQYNEFNLADDLIEVFRPFVDLFVKVELKDEVELNSRVKAKIYNIMNYNIKINNQKQTLSNAIDMFVDSYVKSIANGICLLKNIEIAGLSIHKYE